MAKFIIECPQCHNYTMASKVFHRNVKCGCGYEISVKNDKVTAKNCPHCHNTVVYDQSKGEKALCPVCKEPVNTAESMKNAVELHCPSCACSLVTDKSAPSYTCPLCDTEFDVQKQIEKEKVKNKGLVSVIKYEGSNDIFVWKHPIEDFNLGSQLIVHESQEALFFRDGQALDLFGAGRYTLATQNLPALETLYKLPANSEEIFHSEVYFINLTTQMGIKWGTDSKVRLFDPASGLHIEIGACGEFNLKVENSRKLMLNVVGTSGLFSQENVMGGDASKISNEKSVSNRTMVSHFKSLIVSKVKTYIAKAIKEQSINILELDEHYDELAAYIKDKINEILYEYGLYIPEFFITAINYPDSADFQALRKQFAKKTLLVREEEIMKAQAEAAQSRKLVEAQTEAQLKMVSAQGEAEALKIKAQAEAEAYKAQAFAEAAEMQAKGYSYQQESARMVGMEAMQNGLTGGEGGGGAFSALGDIASLGVSLGAIGGVMGMTKEALNPLMQSSADIGGGIVAATDTWDCVCGLQKIKSKFCPECGTKKPEAPVGWDCECGCRGIASKFCPECGTKKPEMSVGWDCECGRRGITSKFCPECGTNQPK